MKSTARAFSTGEAMLAVVTGFVEELRDAGMDVGTSSVIDALAALSQVDLGSRTQVHTALSATLVKRVEHGPPFERTFTTYFASQPNHVMTGPRRADNSEPATTRSPPVDAGQTDAPEALTDDLRDALSGVRQEDLAELAQQAVQHHGGLDRVQSSERYHLQRVLRAFERSRMTHEVLRELRGDSRDDAFTERLRKSDIDAMFDQFEQLVLEEIRRRQDATARRERQGTGRDALIDQAVENIDFLAATQAELNAIRRAVKPLARRLAARLSQQQRHHARQGALDFRATMRTSLQTGGVPAEPRYRHRRRTKPDLWLLCDVSGSVMEFSRFTLAFVYALHEEFRRIRTFVFVDDLHEITDLLKRRSHTIDPYSLLVRASSRAGGSRSDYGAVLERFTTLHADSVGGRTTLIITGDARSHDRDPRPDLLRELRDRARQVWFLNPEPLENWDEGDSVASDYRAACGHMAEVHTLAQLSQVVAELA